MIDIDILLRQWLDDDPYRLRRVSVLRSCPSP
jgi:hypothetical protein